MHTTAVHMKPVMVPYHNRPSYVRGQATKVMDNAKLMGNSIVSNGKAIDR